MAMRSSSNLTMLRQVAIRLRPLLGEVVFLGGCATDILITDPAAPAARPTTDVDVIAEISSMADYYALSERIRSLGFHEDTSDDAPICRWCIDNFHLDVMPTDPNILGFGNRWYIPAINTAVPIEIEINLSINMVTAPYFIATKLDAFHGRGKNDYMLSHDLEDIVAVIDGRPELIDEICNAPKEVNDYIAEEFANLLSSSGFMENLRCHLPPDSTQEGRVKVVLERIRAVIAGSSN
jgi:predicted nucleotidyltransferase